MKATIDQELCIGCGLCPTIAPEVFEMKDDGKAHEIVDEVPADQENEAQESADSCPTNAIHVE